MNLSVITIVPPLFFINKPTLGKMYAREKIHSMTVSMKDPPHSPEDVRVTGSKCTNT